MAGTRRIKLTGYGDPFVVEAIFDNQLVDVAYVDEITPSGIFVVTEPDVDLNDPASYEWVKSVIDSIFAGSSEDDLVIELE